MKLSIITINYNNAAGLEKTLRSVAVQTRQDFEYVVVDGGSTDGSAKTIQSFEAAFGGRLLWVSEKDKGIYNAMNKGIRMASGTYIQILNSGDCLCSDDVVEKMEAALARSGNPDMLYGNMIKIWPDGRRLRDRNFAGHPVTLLGFIRGTLNHSPAYVRKSLFDTYGCYDEDLRIVSDWKWYLQAVVLGNVKPVYTDIDITLFDMTGISETRLEERERERESELEKIIPEGILADYQRLYPDIQRIRRIQRYPWAAKLVWLLERVLFRWEKRRGSGETTFGD